MTVVEAHPAGATAHPHGPPEGTEVTYTGSFDTDAPDLLDAATEPGFSFVGKAAIRGMHRTLERDAS